MRKLVFSLLLLMLLVMPKAVFAASVTREQYNNAMVQVGLSTATTYQDDFVYTYRWAGTPDNPIDKMSLLYTYLDKDKKGIKTASGYVYGSTKAKAGIHGSFKNKFPVFCGSYVDLMIYQVSGGKITQNDYETIKLSELKKGDIINFPGHVAIYLGDANDNSDYTWEVIEASSKVQTGKTTRPLGGSGSRIKESALSKLDYNLTNASYDYHDRLDDYAPIIKSVKEIENTNKIQINATDYKHYDLSDKSNDLEPENNGIIAYQVKTSSGVPTTNWKSVSKTSNLTITHEVSGNGTYYVFVKDVGGNVTKKEVTLTKIVIDNQKPTLGNFSYNAKTNSIVLSVNNATDNSGIKEYRFYVDGKLSATTANKSYEVKNLTRNKKYTVYYEVVDVYNNVSKSSNYVVNTQIDTESITINNNKINMITGDTQKISPEITANYTDYTVLYKSSNENVCSVDSNGNVKGLKAGECNITVTVGKSTSTVNVKVSNINIEFGITKLPVAHVGKEYKVLIKTNPQAEISANTELPDGLYIENNYLKGVPTEDSFGSHAVSFHAKLNNSSNDKTFLLKIQYDIVIDDLIETKFFTEQEVEETINVNYPGSMTIKSGKLPKGMYLDNNVLSGVPTETGKFTFTVEVEYMNSKAEKEFTIKIEKDETIPDEPEEPVEEPPEDETPIETEDNVDITEQEEVNDDKPVDITPEPKKENASSDTKSLLIIVLIVVVLIGLILIIEVMVDKNRRNREKYR